MTRSSIELVHDGDEPVTLQPDELHNFNFLPILGPFKGRRIINKGNSSDLVVRYIFVGSMIQNPPPAAWVESAKRDEPPVANDLNLPLGDIEWLLEICHPLLQISVGVLNKGSKARNVRFTIHGDLLK